MVVARFDPDFLAELLLLAGQAERNLGLVDAHFATVCHACRQTQAGPAYEMSLASERTPALLREMRRGFPRRGSGGKRVMFNELGALFFVDLTLPDLVAARVRITPA